MWMSCAASLRENWHKESCVIDATDFGTNIENNKKEEVKRQMAPLPREEEKHQIQPPPQRRERNQPEMQLKRM